MKKIVSFAALVVSFCLSTAAVAAPQAPGACSLLDLTYTGTTDSIATGCFGATSGNDQLNPLTVNEMGIFDGGWSYYSKQNTPGDHEGELIGLDVQDPNGSTSGTWSITDGILADFEDYLVVLKAGNAFAAYLVEDTAISSGDWSVESWTNNGLSHFTIYVRGDSATPNDTEVPEPGSLALIALGLAGIVTLRKRVAK